MTSKTTKRKQREVTEAEINEATLAQSRVGISIDDLTGCFVLNQVKGLGPQAFKAIHLAGSGPADVCNDPGLLPIKGKRKETLSKGLAKVNDIAWLEAKTRAVRQILAAAKCDAHILTYKHPAYPPNVFASNYPVPVLYCRGSVSEIQRTAIVACVGTRKIREPFSGWERSFAKVACSEGFSIVSGFAVGADTIGHETALAENGGTICILPGGLDRPFPPENKALWNTLLSYGRATMISEAPFGTSASSLTLRKRNKLIVAFALGVVVAQSSAKGGAMNAFRFAVEAKKPVGTFASDGTEDTSGNALIADYEKGTRLGLAGNSEEFKEWLQKLSSSTQTEQSGTVFRGTRTS